MNAYWDTSALIPCFIAETSTPLVRRWLEEQHDNARFTSWVTVFEFETVLKRKLNRKLVTKEEARLIQEQWSDFQASLNFVPLDNRVARVGLHLQKLHGLLTGDSVQLGSASLLLLEDNDLVFACLDSSLNRVAKAEGFRLCAH